MTVRVRFAPSPTGKVHIGNLRAALFNWLLARHEGGRFLLRIEDTDRERSTAEAIAVLLDAMQWMGLEWDEEPVYQSARLAAHRAAGEALLGADRAFLAPPRVSRWATLRAGELAGVPSPARAVLERLRFEEEGLRAAHRRAFEEANALRPVRKQRAYLEPLLFQPPSGPAGMPALHFRLPGPEQPSRFIRETGEVRSLEVSPDWPVLLCTDGIEFVPAARLRGGEPPELSLFELEQRSLCGFAGLEVLDAGGGVLFALERDGGGLAEGAVRVLPGAAALRFRRREAFVRDLVKGELTKPLEGLGNRVLLRSDGTPVFHLANVVDDHDMGITHIVRGDDHVENTYWHVLLFEALGWEPPRYGHLPMIVNDQGRPLSKRDGDVYVGEYRDKGILPEALFNYLALLGWSPGGDREKLSRGEMAELFTLDRVIATPARFDMEKLLWLNGLYIAERPASELAELAAPFFARAGLDPAARGRAWLEALVALERERLRTLADLPAAAAFHFAERVEPDLSDRKVQKALGAGSAALLGELRGLLAGLEPFAAEAVEQALRDFAEARGLGMGRVSQPIRIAVTGGLVSPPIGATLALAGKGLVLARIDALLARLAETPDGELGR